ncbi:F-box/kelch-repeat protein At3g23880-like [Solanum stenotomum]|uniref:F-box/kelch-repeat protein At3g23880-like n=1 Tax=Solanum stenotomum TaxID=172797 RepID=UPI0020D0D4AD|nr:F-box/kelch-repeat protein At3g23880-like [Solanum stenotomum]
MESEAACQQSKPTKSMLPFSILPPELNTDILLRLPVSSVLKIRTVSKSCLAFTSTPEFIKAHLSVSANHKLLLSFSPNFNLKECSVASLLYSSVLDTSDLDYPMKTYFWFIVGSVNGLICLSNRANELYLWNPSIRKHKKLPNFTFKFRDAAQFIYGFGYDVFHDDYKVVACIYLRGSLPLFGDYVKIYSLKDDSWRSINFPRDWVKSFNCGKFVNGKLNWAYRSYCTGPFWRKGWNIISLDLADEKWEKVETPCYSKEDGVFELGVLENNLSVIRNGNYEGTDLDVWVMKEYGVKESWIKMFTFQYPHPHPHRCLMFLFNPPHLISNKGKILLMCGKTFLLYNLKDESITYPKFTTLGSDLVSVESTYLDSLVSPVLQNDQGHNKNELCESSHGHNCEVKADVRNN